MKQTKVLLMLLCIMLFGVACGGAGNTATAVPPTSPQTVVQPTPLPQDEVVEVVGEAPAACEDYLRFCVTGETSGAVTAVVTTGTNHYQVSNCAEWAATGDARILELPFITAAGEKQMTIALTRIGEYSGPGSYELTAVSTTGMPDMFPTIEVDGRTFSNGNDTTAVVSIAADGSGSLQATSLVEIASLQISNPDPDAKVNFSMQWTCQEQDE